MIDPYKLIIISSTVFILGSLVSFFYFQSKKPIKYSFILFFYSLFPIISIFRKGIYESGDFTTHVYRLISFVTSIKDGIIIPSWASILNATYGYPLFIFLNPLPYYLASLFVFLGVGYTDSIKIILGVSYISSGYFFYHFAYQLFRDKQAAFISSIFYLYAPYHLVDLHFRVAYGETVFFAFLPLTFFSIEKYFRNPKILYFLSTSICFTFLFLTHQAMALLSIFLIGTFYVYRSIVDKKKFKVVIFLALALGIGMICSAYSWIPHVILTKYTMSHILSKQTVSFPFFQELFFSPWRMGFLFQGPKGELSYLIGYSQLLIIILTVLFIFSKNKSSHKKNALFWITTVFFLIFLMTPFSSGIWNLFPILNFIQFSTRLLLLVAFCTATIAGYYIVMVKPKPLFVYGIVTVTVGITILNWGHRRVIPEISETQVISHTPYSTYYGEAFCCIGSPKWVDPNNPWQKKIPPKQIEFISGNGTIRTVSHSVHHHSYLIKVTKNAQIKENTLYFPGWRITNNYKEIPINPSEKKHPGIITFSLPVGIHYIEVSYTDIPILSYTKKISAVSFVSIVFLFFFYLFREKKSDIR